MESLLLPGTVTSLRSPSGASTKIDYLVERIWRHSLIEEGCVRSALENVEFDHGALDYIFRSLCVAREQSNFYSHVLEANADYLNQHRQVRHQYEMEGHQLASEAMEVKNRIRELRLF